MLRLLIVGILGLAGLGWWLGSGEEFRLFALSEADGRVRWSVALPAEVESVGVPVVGGGRVVVSSARLGSGVVRGQRWWLTAFDAASGRQQWQFGLPEASQTDDLQALDTVLAEPFVTAERVYARVERTRGVALIAVDAASGRLEWTFDEAEAGARSGYTDVAVANGRVAVPAREGDGLALQGLDARSGAPLWRVVPDRAALPRTDLGPFLAADESTVFLGINRAALAFDAASGAQRFQIDEPPDQTGGQVWLDGSTLYRRSGLTTIVAHDAATGAPRWTYRQPVPDPGAALRSFRAAGESLYAFCACAVENHGDRGWLLAVDTRDGRERWRAPLDAYIELYQDKLAIGSQTVILGSEREDVVARSAADGSERWRFRRTTGRSVGAADGLVFATDRSPRWRHWLASINPAWH